MTRILFVCMGNICRSPTAEGAFRNLLAREGAELAVEVDSAGTHGYHIGSAPDRRAQAAALARGIDISNLRARQVQPEDFVRFDLILAMDSANHSNLMRVCPPDRRQRIRLFLDFAPGLGRKDVPDPYYGNGRGFEDVLDLVEAASAGLLERLQAGDI